MPKTSKRKTFKKKNIWIIASCLTMIIIAAIVLYIFLYNQKHCDAVCYADKGLKSYNKGKYNQAEKYFNIAIKNDIKSDLIDMNLFNEIVSTLDDMYGPDKITNRNPSNKTGENSAFYNDMMLYSEKLLKILKEMDVDEKNAKPLFDLTNKLLTYDPYTARGMIKNILSSLGGNASKKLRHIMYLLIYDADSNILSLNDGFELRKEKQFHQYNYLKEMEDMMAYDVILGDGISRSLCTKGIVQMHMEDYENAAYNMEKCVEAINSDSLIDYNGEKGSVDIISKAKAYYFLYLAYYYRGQSTPSYSYQLAATRMTKAEDYAKNFIDFCNEHPSELSCDYNNAYYVRGDACMNDGRERYFGECTMIWEEGISLGYDTNGSILKAYQPS